jgi:hypothetical protein
MNFHKPRERLVDGKPSGVWDYTNYNDNQKAFWREGYCAGWPSWADRPFDPEKDSIFAGFFRDQAGKDAYVAEHLAPFRAKYHDNGHANAEECCACKKEYDLDHTLRFHDDRPDADTQHKCEVCGTFTSGQGWIGGYFTKWLCQAHRNRESIAKLYTVGESFGSS